MPISFKVGGIEKNVARIVEGILIGFWFQYGVPVLSAWAGGMYWVGLIGIGWATAVIAKLIIDIVPDKWKP